MAKDDHMEGIHRPIEVDFNIVHYELQRPVSLEDSIVNVKPYICKGKKLLLNVDSGDQGILVVKVAESG